MCIYKKIKMDRDLEVPPSHSTPRSGMFALIIFLINMYIN